MQMGRNLTIKIKNKYLIAILLFALTCSLSACSSIGEKSMSLAIVYGAIALISLALLVVYCISIKKKDPWFVALFASIFLVNTGYFALAISRTLEEALLANRIAYLGSVFLPLFMLMIIMNVVHVKYRSWFPICLLIISIFVFFVAASPGYLDIYYKSVTLQIVDGVAMLKKVYGPWHSIYLYYLLAYFSLTLFMVIRSYFKNKGTHVVHSVILSGVTIMNIGVWLLGQLVRMDFEFLSVSYVLSEIFLIFLCAIIQEEEKRIAAASETVFEDQSDVLEDNTETALPESEKPVVKPNEINEEEKQFVENLKTLTPTEKIIYEFYVEGKTTKEVLVLLNIKENTLKYHNKNIYGKLNVSSRKQLVEIAKRL